MTSSAVVWLTGLPSSGKSTLATKLTERLRERGVPCCLLDGDEVRDALNPRPGYDDPSRAAFYATLANLAALLERQGLIVVVAATAHRRDYRERARRAARRFIEVWVDVPLSECRRRDSKGLYAAAEAKQTDSVPGADEAYEPPLHADLVARGGLDSSALDLLGRLLAPEPPAGKNA
jgi:adenylylsulfate kinase